MTVAVSFAKETCLEIAAAGNVSSSDVCQEHFFAPSGFRGFPYAVAIHSLVTLLHGDGLAAVSSDGGLRRGPTEELSQAFQKWPSILSYHKGPKEHERARCSQRMVLRF